MSDTIEIVPVATRKQQKQFLDLPAQLYRDIPQWTPRIRASESALAGFTHHAFHDQADCRAILAMRGGEVCGRLVAIDNRAHGATYPDERIGFIGFYESTDDLSLANRMFDAASDWFVERSIRVIRGPVSPSMNYEAGLLIDGFDMPPAFMMPYSHAYYPAIWEARGFQKIQDLFAFRTNAKMLKTMSARIQQISATAEERYNASFRTVDRRRFQQDVETFLQLYNAASAQTWAFVPLSDMEIKELAAELKYLIIPELTTIMMVGNEVVGAAFGILDYNPIIRKNRGRLFPFGFLRMLWNRRRLKAMRMMSVNVLPRYQRWGLGVSLLGAILRQSIDIGLTDIEFSYVLESNQLACQSLERGGALREKTYRVYQKPL